eukprot:10835972-Lingulodinium_polyedra.AAC.1
MYRQSFFGNGDHAVGLAAVQLEEELRGRSENDGKDVGKVWEARVPCPLMQVGVNVWVDSCCRGIVDGADLVALWLGR